MKPLTTAIYDTKFGKIKISSDGESITGLRLCDATSAQSFDANATPLTDKAARQLDEYFCGTRFDFDIPLNLRGTDFQKAVWRALLEIPFGETRSYKQIAQAVGNPKAYRAVGSANNRNPVWIIVPCHRVIGSDGSLTGYGCGISVKEKLLEFERIYIKRGAELTV